MPLFLSTQQVYRMLQRELPPNAYPDGAPSAFYSTADMGSVAKVVAGAYCSLSAIYDNYFPNYAVDTEPDFEMLYFGNLLSSALSFSQRQALLLAKIRSRQSTRAVDMLSTVYTVIASSIPVEIVQWNSPSGSWCLDFSQLDVETALDQNSMAAFGPSVGCSDGSPYGYTAPQWAAAQTHAYTYEVRIYGYQLQPTERTSLDAALAVAEPARSAHVITDNLPVSGMINGGS